MVKDFLQKIIWKRGLLFFHHKESTVPDVPVNPLHDDLYIVSFPKSGTTWLCTIMTNIHLKMSSTKQSVSFFNMTDFIPDVNCGLRLKEKILDFPGFRVIRAHSEYHPAYQKVIYLVRDPRDVMVSYWWFRKHLGHFSGGLSEFIRSEAYGIDTWCRHVQGWVEKTPAMTSIDFVRYEDLRQDPLKAMNRIYTLLGYQLLQTILEESLALSSFENMKKMEAYYNYGGNFRFPGFRFVRKGEAEAYHSEMSEHDVQFINQKASRWLSLFQYGQ